MLVTGRPEWKLDDDEKTMMAQAGADVAKHYDLAVFDQKTLDWFNLVQCVVIIYGVRLYDISKHKRQERLQGASRPAAPPPQRAGVQQPIHAAPAAPASAAPTAPTAKVTEPPQAPPEWDAIFAKLQEPPKPPTAAPARNAPAGAGAVTIAGVPGAVTFPADHPLARLMQ